jgi:hypothetical protein
MMVSVEILEIRILKICQDLKIIPENVNPN